MRCRLLFGLSLLLVLCGAFFLIPRAARHSAVETDAKVQAAAAAAAPVHSGPIAAGLLNVYKPALDPAATNAAASKPGRVDPLKYRLANTPQPLRELIRSDRAVLLENALIDTARPLDFSIPDALRSQGDPGSYIVQARGPVDDAFRAELIGVGAEIVSYIPNNAYLVRASAAAAEQLSSRPETRSVLPYEPYYKLKSVLLPLAIEDQPLPPNGALNVLVFPGSGPAARDSLAGLGADIVGESPSPFGTVIAVHAREHTLAALARLPEVQSIELSSRRQSANDLSRARMQVAADTVTQTNYLSLFGSNILVAVNDSGVDAAHPDLTNRVSGADPLALFDTIGHGTHVAGIIAGDGTESLTVTNANGSIMPASTNQFRGMASMARILSQSIFGSLSDVPDFDLQKNASSSNALISNNSWNYQDTGYDMAAASYDAAVRDAHPEITGSQPLVFVFAAGNNGGGEENGLGGFAESIQSPATAKNVITVGASEILRNITNAVVIDCHDQTNADGSFVTNTDGSHVTICTTNTPWAGETDSERQVASFSGRGNVGIGVEGDFGRFKPDVVAPGTFIISDRSQQWDTNAYYSITNTFDNTFFNQTLNPNTQNNYAFFIPQNAVKATITVSAITPTNVTALPIYVNATDLPTTGDFVGVNQYVFPLTSGQAGKEWFYAIGNPSNVVVQYQVTTEITVTNNLKSEFDVLRTNLNDALGGTNGHYYYRYESGTSMSAGQVSGALALIEDFFKNRLSLAPPSPALLKAMLINGARPLDRIYDFEVGTVINYEGWGLINLTNSLPMPLTNGIKTTSTPVLLIDQNPTNALSTGDSRTYTIKVADDAIQQQMRVTLVWTDPPGNPAAGVKLVNNLDLIVTNTDSADDLSGAIYFGNDIGIGSDINFPWDDTEGPPNVDVVNNVENIFIAPPLAKSYTITVVGKNVNANAVTANPNKVAQDYALVVSVGNGRTADALSISNDTGVLPANAWTTTEVTNSFAAGTGISGSLLLGQHVGASSPLLGTNQLADPSGNGRITVGLTNQWHFYVISNETTFTNAAFVTFLPPNLSVQRMGVTNEDSPDLDVRPEADIDLYVSTNAALTNLDLTALAGADKSLGRSGTEVIVYTNSAQGRTYYIGVKSEDQQAAEYGFLGAFAELPFSQRDKKGNIILHGVPVPQAIPDGSPAHPGAARILGISPEDTKIRHVIVTNTITHSDFGDLIGDFSHAGTSVVLNNHTFGNGLTQTHVYDDAGGFATQRSDGPGSLQEFVGAQSAGVWLLTEVDSALTHTGHVDSLWVRLEPQQDTNNGVTLDIDANSFAFDFIDVPPEATNLTITAGGNTLPLQFYIRHGDLPDFTNFDYTMTINPGATNVLSISDTDLPPLTPGRYYFGVFNPNGVSQTVRIDWTLSLDVNGVSPSRFGGSGQLPLADDAVADATQVVTNDLQIATVSVGVRLSHPRVSDLALTLISPSGQRFVLFENRGGPNTADLGSGTTFTNVFPQTTSGGPSANTNIIETGSSSGTLVINYDFLNEPDSMDIYYNNIDISPFTGFTNGSGTLSIPYGPGPSSQIKIIMNQNGNPTNSTQWTYTASVISKQYSYLTFTDDTNFAQEMIKFALPPYSAALSGSNFTVSGFETTPNTYVAPATVDGWSVTSNEVSVVNDTNTVFTGTNFLALADGTITRTIPVTRGKNYALSYAYRGPAAVSSWSADNTTADQIDSNTGTLLNGASYGAGFVGTAAFSFASNIAKVYLGDPTNLMFTNSFSIEGWVFCKGYPSAITDGHAQIFYRGDARGSLDPYFLCLEPSGVARFHVEDASGTIVEINSPNPIALNQWVHLAGSFDGSSGRMVLYTNGVAAISTNTTVRPFQPLVGDGGVAIGCLSQSNGGQSLNGRIDDLAVYSRAISAAEVHAIFAAGSAGKYDVAGTLPGALAEAQVTLGNNPASTLFGVNSNWTTLSVPFTATSSNISLTIRGVEPGMLLDAFSLTRFADDLFVLPEESLQPLVGQSAKGTWALEVWDTRTGAVASNALLDWQLRFIFQTNTVAPIPLVHGVVRSNTIPACQTAYFTVDVPSWATFATNILVSTSPALPVNVFFNQDQPPTGTNAGDIPLINGSSGTTVLNTTNSSPQLIPGRRYYIGVQNPCANAASVTVTMEVDFDITALTNMVPLTSVLSSNEPVRYFSYTVTNPASVAALFQLFGLDGNVDLVARKGAPLPTLFSADYASFNLGTNNENIVVATNSSPVPLTTGTWYLGVFNRDGADVNYTIEASEVGAPTIIPLTNDVAVNFNSESGPALTNFFSFTIDQTNSAALFELYNLSGNVDLTLQRGSPPYAIPPSPIPPYLYGSFNLGTNFERIVLRTNAGLPDINGTWFLGVPNNDPSNVTYTIRAVVATNGVLNSIIPINITVAVAGGTNISLTWGPTIDGETYEVQTNINLATTNWGAVTDIVANGGSINFVDPNPVGSLPALFYRIVQVP
jgi:subtilisin-like proprotein convertase family protein